MRKSCLIQIILLILIAVTIALSINKWLGTSQDAGPTAVAVAAKNERTASPQGLVTRLSKLITGAVAGPTLPPSPPKPRAIEGLRLQVTRPLILENVLIQGLSADTDHIYVTGTSSDHQTALIYQLTKETGTVVQVRQLSQDGYVAVGGLTAADDKLWLSLTQPTSNTDSLILTVSADNLETLHRLIVPDKIHIVAAISTDSTDTGWTLVGINQRCHAMYTWNNLGHQIASRTIATGARYQDAEVIHGRLVCAGTDPQGGVIDVFDTQTMSLIVHHRSDAAGPNNLAITSGGFAFWSNTFYFALPADRWPQMLSYQLDQYSLSDYVPTN